MGSNKTGSGASGIVARINRTASNITEDDLDDWVVPELVKHYSNKISALAAYVYGKNNPIGQSAFREYANETLRRGAYTFLFKSQHWRNSRNINPYLITCLNRLGDRLKSDVESRRKLSVPTCPGCRALGVKEYLHYDGQNFRCPVCESESQRLEYEPSRDDRQEYELSIRSIFAVHSRKGCRCPECHRFIPRSYIRSQKLSCPYDRCLWFGESAALEEMSHPMGISTETSISLNDSSYKTIGKPEWQENITDDVAGADLRMEVQQRCTREYETVKDVIETQITRVMKEPASRAIKKQMMYQAYYNMFHQSPEEMISYLAHQKVESDLPIQCQIFQEFVRLVENSLPFNIHKFGRTIEVYSLLDPYLDLFLGMSTFTSAVRPSGLVPNNTTETYVGGREKKNHGPCFIGLLCDAKVDGRSIMDKVEHYTFSHLKLWNVAPGTKVEVTHMRMPSHYEMNGLVQLQRIRRRIVDSVYQRLNGKRRTPKGGLSETY
jgi:hypothetical protein